MRRTGIDLSSTRCLLVDADFPGRGPRADAKPLRVQSYASLPVGVADDAALTAELKERLTRKALAPSTWVNLWDVRSIHQYLLLPTAQAAEFESLARHRGASALGLNDADVTVAIQVGSIRNGSGQQSKTEVSFFAAGTEEIRRRLRPLLQAGLRVEGVTTPCGALWAQARLRRAPPGAKVHAHVVIGSSQSALGIFSSGSLLYGRDLDWGYSATAGVPAPMNRDELAGRLSVELRQSFLYLKQYWEEDVSQVLLCGDLPEIRSLTVPLIERLNIEVETLDTLEGIDTSSLPAGFADQAASFRLASSIAADPPPVNLLPAALAVDRTDRRTPRMFAAATAAAFAVAAFLYGHAGMARVKTERQIASVEREMSNLRPRAVVAQATSAGPSMARLLAAFANAVPDDVLVTSLRVSSEGDHRNVAIQAVATGGNVPRAQATVKAFFHNLPVEVFGQPIEPISSPTTSGDAATAELAASYRVRK